MPAILQRLFVQCKSLSLKGKYAQRSVFPIAIVQGDATPIAKVLVNGYKQNAPGGLMMEV